MWTTPILAGILTLLLLLASGGGDPQIDSFWQRLLMNGFDKFLHFTVFGLLASACLRTLELHRLPRPGVIAFLFALIIAATDELLQAGNPHRMFDLYDFAANFLGITTFILLHQKLPLFRKLLHTPLLRLLFPRNTSEDAN